MSVCPCKNCTDRSAECHANCEKYGLWKSAEFARNQQIFESKVMESTINKVQMQGIKRMTRGGRKKR